LPFGGSFHPVQVLHGEQKQMQGQGGMLTLKEMNRKDHWQHVYQTKDPTDVSWFQSQPTLSLRLIGNAGLEKNQGIIDVGGGASVMAGCLLGAGFRHVAVLDISADALKHAKQRLGAKADAVEWLEADVTGFTPPRQYDLWHDRAVFHFLTDKADRRKYVQTLKRTLTPGGHVIIATFAVDGPMKCSGLDVARYDASGICTELGSEFRLVEQVNETHVTPWNTEQKFSYFRFIRKPGSLS
jgi:ubiquinone/menaquinone biosynthesis C-methylase UbiE